MSNKRQRIKLEEQKQPVFSFGLASDQQPSYEWGAPSSGRLTREKQNSMVIWPSRKRGYVKRKAYSRSRYGKGSVYGGGYWKRRYWNRVVRGRGDYFPKGMFANAGGALGRWAGAGLSKLVGFGDYSGSSGVPNMASNVPEVINGGKSNIIRHREYIGDVISSATPGAFNSTTFAVQPGSIKSFPWLAAIAECFQEWKPQGIIYEFRTTSGNALNSVNTALGTVIMASEYNVLNPPFVNKQQMENSEFAVSCKPSESMSHGIECDMTQTPLDKMFVRTGSIPSTDLRFNDIANMTVATVGLQGASVNVGELWVTYQIEFMKPILPQPAGSGYIEIDPTSSTPTTAFGTVPKTNEGISGGGSIVLKTVNQFVNMPNLKVNQRYLALIQINGTAILTGHEIGANFFTTGTNLTLQIDGDTTWGTGTGRGSCWILFQTGSDTTGLNNTLSFLGTGADWWVGPTQVILIINEYNTPV